MLRIIPGNKAVDQAKTRSNVVDINSRIKKNNIKVVEHKKTDVLKNKTK